MANKINHLLEAYRQFKRQPDNIVLATIIETLDSTYQKAGARMLMTRNGEMNGLLGGGCFEKDLMEQSASVFETGQPKTIFYDMRAPEDVIWGLGLGCNGAVRVLLQLLTAEDNFHPLDKLMDAAEANESGVLITPYESEHPDFPAGNSIFLNSLAIGHESSPDAPYSPFAAPARQTLLQHKSHIESHIIDGHDIKAFYDPIEPLSHLLLLGAGADAVPVLQCAKALGWRVTVVDHRPGHVKKERFPEADRLLCLAPDDLNDQLELDRFDAMVLMTHNIEYDERYLKVIAGSRIPFIGLLGPAPRRDRLLQSLGTSAEQLKERVFGPIGLDIGAETPEEIALSIMAGIHAALSGRAGGQLSPKIASDFSHDHERIQR